MATLNGINYAKTQNNQKIAPGELNGRVKAIYEKYSLSAVVAANDEILGPIVPEGALIIGAWLRSPSMGVTGIFDLGLKAHVDINGSAVAEDQDGLVSQADAGGQAVHKQGSTEALIGSKIGKGGAQMFAKCTEVTANSSGDVEMMVEYLLP